MQFGRPVGGPSNSEVVRATAAAAEEDTTTLQARRTARGSGEEKEEVTADVTSSERPPIRLPSDPHGVFDCNTNALNGYSIHEIYDVDFDGENLGEGGFGTVFPGTHLYEVDTPVAIKQVSFQINTGRNKKKVHKRKINTQALVKRMEENVVELDILKRFRHHYLMVHMHEFFVATDLETHVTSLYIVTEFLPGGELFYCIKDRVEAAGGSAARTQAFSEGDVRNIFRVLLEAVAYMHSQNVVHRDLKPSNLLLVKKDCPTSIKIADFGQSKVLPASETTRTCCGTLGYRPPEMFQNKPYTHSVDLFSSGCILFFLLAGYQPFSRYPKHKIMSKTIRCEYKTDLESWKRVSPKAKSLVKGLLAEPEHRLTLQQLFDHDWMREEENVEYLKADLTENVKALEINLDLELESDEPIAVAVPAVASDIYSREESKQSDDAIVFERYARKERANRESEAPRAVSSDSSNDQPTIDLTMFSNAIYFDETRLGHLGTDIPDNTMLLIEYIAHNVAMNDYTEAMARSFIQRSLEAVARLHRNKIVHRNVSLYNLLIVIESGQVFLKDMTFITRFSPGEHPLTGYCGTQYRITAPEVYIDFSYSEKVDIWSIGIISYFLLQGIDPFHGIGSMPEVKRMSSMVEFPFGGDAPSKQALDFVRFLLNPDSNQRPSAEQALQHEWFLQDEASLKGLSLGFAHGGFPDWNS